MAPMGVSPPIGLTNHGGVEALGLLCARCGGLVISLCPEGSNQIIMSHYRLTFQKKESSEQRAGRAVRVPPPVRLGLFCCTDRPEDDLDPGSVIPAPTPELLQFGVSELRGGALSALPALFLDLLHLVYLDLNRSTGEEYVKNCNCSRLCESLAISRTLAAAQCERPAVDAEKAATVNQLAHAASQ